MRIARDAPVRLKRNYPAYQEIGYWTERKDRNYSDEEILKRVDWNKYPTLTMLREGQQKGRPAQLNRAIDFDSDTVLGMLWSTRNGKTSGSSTIDAARYALGEGRQYEPDEIVRAMRDPANSMYNPYALGSTVDEAAEYFGVDGFDQKWLNDNKGILKSGNDTAIKAYNQVYGAKQFTKAAEEEKRKLSERINARLNKAVSAGVTLDANVLLKDAIFGLDTLQSMDEGLKSGDLAQLTRPVNYRWQDVANQVNGQVQVINARQNAPHNPADLGLAARNEEKKVIQGQGTLIQKDAVPKSYTSFREKMPGLWAAGLTKNPLSAGWYAPARGEQSGFGPDQVKTQAIADARREGDFAAAAGQGYDALMGSGGDISKLSTNEGAVRMAIDLVLDSAKAFAPQQTAIPDLQATANRYDAAVNNILGIDPTAVAQILPQIMYATTVQGDIKNQASGTTGLLSVLLRLDEGALKTVTDHVLGDDPSLQTVQTMFRMLKLRDMETGTKSKAFQAAEAALMKAAGNTLQYAAAQTGHAELDDLTIIAGKSSHNLDAVLKRWGLQGVNYICNLLKAGRGDLAAAIMAMPTYAKSAIVAETNMRTFGLNDAAVAAQESALASDMKSPIVVLSAKQIAKQQAVEARKAELNAGGSLKVQSVLVQKVNDAEKIVDQSKPVLNQAVRNEKAGRDLLAKAQALFHKNMADTAATDSLVTAIDQLKKAINARAKAQKALKQNQQTLFDVQQKLNDAQKQAKARVDEQAKQDVDAMRLSLAEIRAKLMKQTGGQEGEQGNLSLDQKQLLDMQDAAPGDSLHLNGNPLNATNDLRNGNGQPPLQSVDLASERLSLLANNKGSGIIKEDRQHLESDTTTVSQGKGNRPFRALAASGAATDVGYANGASTIGLQNVTSGLATVPSTKPAPPNTAGTNAEAGSMAVDADSADWMAVGAGNNPYSHMGIQDADYQAYLDGKLTEDDLITIANAAELYKEVVGGSGNWAYIYQNLAHDLTRNIRVKYDLDYIKNDTYDYTHKGKYNSSSIEPMPGAPKYNKWTRLTVDARASTGQGGGYSIFESSRPPKLAEKGKPAPDFGVNDKEKSDLGKIAMAAQYMADIYDQDAYGILQVENTMKKLAYVFTLGDPKMRDVALDMFQHFMDGSGADYSNPVLTERVIEHPSTQDFVAKTMEEIQAFLSLHKGDLAALKADEGFRRNMYGISRPKYNNAVDLLDGLTITLNDTWGYYIDIADYKSDGKIYNGTIRYTVYDHFGLDEIDISEKNWYKGMYWPFAAWYALQHYKGSEGKYQPFVTYFEFEVPFSGSIK